MLVNIFDFEEETPQKRLIKPILIRNPAENPFSNDLFERILAEYLDAGVPVLKAPVSKFIDDLAKTGKKLGPYRVDSVCFRRLHTSQLPEEGIRKGIEGLINEAKRKQAVVIAKCEFNLDKSRPENKKADLLEFYGHAVIPLYAGQGKIKVGFCR